MKRIAIAAVACLMFLGCTTTKKAEEKADFNTILLSDKSTIGGTN